ncbi:MAG TPA: PKD domain-containing protein [Bacteroidia bacterium]|jgi:gliding motility-associated-like protein|nr:PKD domain-containing protein [Bacteroidia bacterium]
MKNKLLIVVSFIFFLPFISMANHIVGGSLTYEQMGGSTYRITLALYRDCTDPTNPSFPSVVKINIVKNNGAAFKVATIAFSSATSVPSKIDTCVANPGICLQEAIYSQVVTGITPSAGGYHVYYQLCCRTSALLNINNPATAGETFYTHIPDNNLFTNNSSPQWKDSPQSFLCQGSTLSIDHGAVDADGDSLAYSLYTPYDSNTVTFPGGLFTAVPLAWKTGYGQNNPFNAGAPNSLQISSKGIITGSPPLTSGNFVIGVRCQEWRNGVKLGEVLRDFQIKVVVCPPKILANYTFTGNCNGTKVSFTTTTVGANTYYWDFGNTKTLADTSRSKNPTYTYTELGKYKVKLIIAKGTPCADTLIQTVHVTSLNAAFTSNTPSCQKAIINFSDISVIDTSNTITAWNWNFGDGNTSTLKNPKNSYANSGSFIVNLVVTAASGCKDTATQSVSVQTLPIANAGNDTIRCANNPAILLNGKVTNAGGGRWVGTGMFTPSNTVLNPSYIAAANSIKKGADTLLFITTSNALCPPDTDKLIIQFSPAPTVDVGKDVIVCKDTVSIPVCATITVATGVTWKSLGSGIFTSDSTKLCTGYKPSKADTLAGYVILVATTTGNGNCLSNSDSMRITFTSIVNVDILATDSICSDQLIPVDVSVTTNSGMWTSNGTGYFTPFPTSLKGYYIPSKADSINGKVILIFTSSNNGNCLMRKDSVTVSILPAPTAYFSSVTACEGHPAIFTDLSVPANQIIKWLWNFGDTFTADVKNPSHAYTKGGTYPVTLIVSSQDKCRDTLQAPISINYNPVAHFSSLGVCLKEGVQFQDSTTVIGDSVIKWIWNFGDGKTADMKNPLHHFPTYTTYSVSLIVESSKGCIDSIKKSLNIKKGPIADFTSDNPLANVKQPVHFSDKSIDGVSWFWNFGDTTASNHTSTLQNPTHTYDEIGHFNVCLFVTDKNECLDTICKTEIISLPVGVPNAFSPNGDGQNDFFSVYGGAFTDIQMKIFNNWGDVIFVTDKQSGWDGRVAGVDQPAGVYIYTVYCVSEDGETHKLSGDVTLIR